jgi:hypothetical protein
MADRGLGGRIVQVARYLTSTMIRNASRRGREKMEDYMMAKRFRSEQAEGKSNSGA